MDTVVADDWYWAGVNRRLLHKVDAATPPITIRGITFWFAVCGAVVLPATGRALEDRQRCVACKNNAYFCAPSKEGLSVNARLLVMFLN